MSITTRYAQAIPEAPPVIETPAPKEGKAGAAGKDGAAGQDLVNLPPLYLDTSVDGTSLILDLALSRQFRITAHSEFDISFTNWVDGIKFSVAVIQANGGTFTPTFNDDIMWNLNAGAPTLDDPDGVHSVYGFEYWEQYGQFDGYLLGKTLTPQIF